jgi:hypothetical protein
MKCQNFPFLIKCVVAFVQINFRIRWVRQQEFLQFLSAKTSSRDIRVAQTCPVWSHQFDTNISIHQGSYKIGVENFREWIENQKNSYLPKFATSFKICITISRVLQLIGFYSKKNNDQQERNRRFI